MCVIFTRHHWLQVCNWGNECVKSEMATVNTAVETACPSQSPVLAIPNSLQCSPDPFVHILGLGIIPLTFLLLIIWERIDNNLKVIQFAFIDL